MQISIKCHNITFMCWAAQSCSNENLNWDWHFIRPIVGAGHLVNACLYMLLDLGQRIHLGLLGLPYLHQKLGHDVHLQCTQHHSAVHDLIMHTASASASAESGLRVAWATPIGSHAASPLLPTVTWSATCCCRSLDCWLCADSRLVHFSSTVQRRATFACRALAKDVLVCDVATSGMRKLRCTSCCNRTPKPSPTTVAHLYGSLQAGHRHLQRV
jgi:hypothetical protein